MAALLASELNVDSWYTVMSLYCSLDCNKLYIHRERMSKYKNIFRLSFYFSCENSNNLLSDSNLLIDFASISISASFPSAVSNC